MVTGTDNKNANILEKRSLLNYFLLLFGLSTPCWVLGEIYDVQIFPGLKLFQLPLAMPMVAAIILIYKENGKSGLIALLKRTYDVRHFKPGIWFIPTLLLFPSIGFLDYWIMSLSGMSIPTPNFSFAVILG
jgi:hypothetical protein